MLIEFYQDVNKHTLNPIKYNMLTNKHKIKYSVPGSKGKITILMLFGVMLVMIWQNSHAFQNGIYSANTIAQNVYVEIPEYQETISGQVRDSETGELLPGVNVILQGTTVGTATDVYGEYELVIPELSGTLIFSFVGYINRSVEIDGRNTINIELQPSILFGEDIVVTALGLRREARSLGYSVQEVTGDRLDKARESNIVNSLSGKLAGVNITQGGTGPTATSRIVIRGETSLSGDNQPLFVVDGVPINNQTHSIERNSGTQVADFGNMASDINPDDVESITVLKGANAAALYGSRAANGVVLITTKSGQGREGIGISFNSSSMFESPLRLWSFQNDYGVGSNFAFEYVDGTGGGTNDFIDESWGPRLDGREIKQHDSPTTNGYRCGDTAIPLSVRGECLASPFTNKGTDLRDFYETGISMTNNISVTGANEDGHFRLSYTNLNNTGILPNTNLKRNNFSLNAGYKPMERLSIDISANYVNTNSDNVANSGYGTESVEYTFTWWARNTNFANLREYWQRGQEGIEQFNYNYNWNDNPYFTLYENTNAMNRDRLFGNIRINYEVTDKLNLMFRSGTDLYNDFRDSRRAFSTQRFPLGMYREDRYSFLEVNTDLLVSYRDNITEDLEFAVSVGGNRMDQNSKRLRVTARELNVPGVYSLSNNRNPLEFFVFNTERRINSIYGTAQFGFRNYLFLDLTARNDWSSTLPEDNNSYFYPSATVSLIFSDILDLGRHVSFGKFRIGYAEVGSDTNPYRLRNYYQSAGVWGSIQTAGEQAALNNANLKPEIAQSYEIGTDIRFFNDRVGLDVTYYTIDSRNQIIEVPVSRSSGYDSRVLNAGLVNSRGWEIMLNLVPIQTIGFTWNTNINWSWDRTIIEELAEGLETYRLPSDYVQVQARVGERMGDIWGIGLERAEDGRVIHNTRGFPIRSTELRRLGNYNPDWMLGFENNFRIKNFNIGFLMDLSFGGVVYSRSYLIRHTSGVHANTADREGTFISEGWVDQGDGTLVENTIPLSGRDYYWSLYNRNNHAEGMMDATFGKLRELRVGYNIPSRFFGDLVRRANVSIVGRNLLLWTRDDRLDFDPDQLHFTSAGNINPGVQVSSPPNTRSIGFNVNFEF